MEAYFDNKGDVLNARIRVLRDDSAVYTVKTTFGLRGRKITVLRDENPTLGRPAVVGCINWKQKTMDVCGSRRAMRDVKRTEGRFFKKYIFRVCAGRSDFGLTIWWVRSHLWRWGQERKKEYQIEHDKDGWKVRGFNPPLRPLAKRGLMYLLYRQLSTTIHPSPRNFTSRSVRGSLENQILPCYISPRRR